MSILGKGKALVFTNNVEIYSKEILSDKIYRLTIVNIQLMINKIETKKIRVNLETDRMQLFDEKNSLVVKRKELRAEIVILNVTGSFNVLIRGYQDPLLKPM